MADVPPPAERLLGDYGGANAQTGRLTIVNQPVNVANFQLHPSTINQLKRKNFTGKKDRETLGDAYKRFKRVLVACPTHNMDATEQMQMFVNGLKIKTKQLIDTATGGSTKFLTATGIKKVIEAIAANEHMELYDRCQSKPEGVIDLKLETNKICIEDIIVAEVDKKLKVEEIKFLKQNNPYFNTYNPGWKNHPNFSWKDQKGITPQHGQYETKYQQQQQQHAPKKDDWEIAIERMAAHNVQFQEETRNNQKNTTASIKNIQVQMGQIAQQLASSFQAQGALPSATVTNPREHNNVSAVTTRRGKSEEVVEEVDEEEDQLIEVDLEIKENEVVREEVAAPKPVVKETGIEPKPVVKLPFPTRNKKKGQHEKIFEKFLELFKKLEINIPLLEALEQMPTYAKFMKDIISKRRTADTNPIILTETCSAILQGMKIPIKKKDRGAITIPSTLKKERNGMLLPRLL
ncbi:uncharacterized protein LOC127131999 [Lathyrus oleraceus]|uniref:uncharacterized protein LOC127131999 n=1 Tax=Pisum sativum TaxID=3888 RepID=UPI0021D18E8C|nr:uncharacterized protein LOC127131999 [Pisum sativum]